MFPLGTALLPGMPLPLRLFEPRYLTMLDDVLRRDPADFGVVLIERGSEVGGGDARFDVGCLAELQQVDARDGGITVVAIGTQRLRVERWGEDDPYPQADVSVVDELEWSEDHRELLDRTEEVVRSVLAQAAEFVEPRWPSTIELDDDPITRCWQLGGIALLGTLDQVDLLRATSVPQLLGTITEHTRSALEVVQISAAE
ncbi:MAG: LON peptidase substrate-binding domain-containing protein [Aeromicrobium erythreum]